MGTPLTKRALAVAMALFTAPALLSAALDENQPWRTETTSDGTSITKRHETGSVVVDGNLYVFGGRSNRPVEVYKPSTDGWENLGAAPTEIHHFQPVAVGSKIYVIGAMTCCFPNEPTVADIHVFNTANSNWSTEGQMPANRLRGGGGAVIYNGKIYVVGGNTQGHSGGAVSWFDEFDPATGIWTTMPDAPTARDHFQAAVVGNELIVTGGRQTHFPNPFANTVAQTNIFNFQTGQWRTGAPIPTQRAGSPTVSVGNEVVVLGGEVGGRSLALDTVEAYDVSLNQWRSLQPMQLGRHSGAGGVIDNRLHMVSGSSGTGGGPETTSHESLLLNDVVIPEPEAPVQEPQPQPEPRPVLEEEVQSPAEEPVEEPVEVPSEQPVIIVVDESLEEEKPSEEIVEALSEELTGAVAGGDTVAVRSSGGGSTSWSIIALLAGLLGWRRRGVR